LWGIYDSGALSPRAQSKISNPLSHFCSAKNTLTFLFTSKHVRARVILRLHFLFLVTTHTKIK
jgi:hypothetical protein